MKTLFGPKRSVYVTKTLSAKSIYVQLKENWDTVEELGLKMNDNYRLAVQEDEYPLQIEDIKPELVVATQYSVDEKWYRAQVVDVKRKKGLVKVFYIDFGNTETVDLKFCRFLKPEFRKDPALAIHCRPLNEGLEADTLEMFELSTHEVECEFVALHENEIMDVRLYDNGALLGGDSSVASPQRPSKVEDKVEETPVLDKTEVKTKESPINKTVILSLELMSEREAFLSSLVGREAKVIISNAIDSKSIYCQLLENKTEIIDPLIEDMNDVYNNKSEQFEPLTDSLINLFKDNQSLIAVYCDLENRWMRAILLNVCEEEMVEVFYVDFGTKEKLHRSNCRELCDIYFGEIGQAIHCEPRSISYYELKKLESSEKTVVVKFMELTENLVLKISLKLW